MLKILNYIFICLMSVCLFTVNGQAQKNLLEDQFKEAKRLYQSQRYDEARVIFEQLAEQGDDRAMNYLAAMYEAGDLGEKDIQKANELFRQCAKLDNALCQYNLALNYRRGKGLPVSEETALEWLFKSAENGYSGAQYEIGLVYTHGSGKYPQDGDKAKYWYEQAISGGDGLAANNLGILYQTGEYGLPKDMNKAFQYFKKSAELGDKLGQFSLAISYHNAEGTQKDMAKAYEWYVKAAEQGNQQAIDSLKKYFDENFEQKPSTSVSKDNNTPSSKAKMLD